MAQLRPVRNVSSHAFCSKFRVGGVVIAVILAHGGVGEAAAPAADGGGTSPQNEIVLPVSGELVQGRPSPQELSGACETGGDDSGLGNDVIADAMELGVITQGVSRQIEGAIGNTAACDLVPFFPGDHDADVYHFTLVEASDVSLRVDALGNLDCTCTPETSGIGSLWLYGADLALIGSSDSAGGFDATLNTSLEAGEYYVLVAAAGQISAPDAGGLSLNPACSVANAPEVDGGSTDPTGCYELNVAVVAFTEPTPAESGAAPAWEGSMRVSTYSTVNLVDGNMLTEIPIVSWAGRGPDVAFGLYHNSGDGAWRTSYSATFVDVSPTVKRLTTDDGREILFTWDGSRYVVEAGYHLDYSRDPLGARVVAKSGRVMVFDGAGRLIVVRDSAGNELGVSYAVDQMVIGDAAGRVLVVDYYPSGELKKITDANLDSENPRVWTFLGAILEITDAMGFKIQFGYTAQGAIGSIRDKSGATFTFGYDGARLMEVTDPATVDQGVQRFVYSAPVSIPFTPVTQYIDRRGSTFAFTYDAALNMTGYADPTREMGFVYDGDHNMTTYADGVGLTWSYTYDTRGNLLTARNHIGQVRRWFYEHPTNPDLLTKFIDGENNAFLYAYDSAVDPYAVSQITLPPAQPGEAVGIISLDYSDFTNSKGQLRSVTDANGVSTVYRYDNTGQPLSETEGSGAGNWKVETDYTFDAGSRLKFSDRDGTTASPFAATAPLPGITLGPNTSTANHDFNNRLTDTDCTYKDQLTAPPSCSSCCPDAFGMLQGNIDEILYDDMDRPVSAQFSLNNSATGEISDIFYNLNWDKLGRLTSVNRGSPEGTAHIAGNPLVNRSFGYSYNWTTGVSSRDSANGVRTTVTTDALSRVETVTAEDAATSQTLYSADITYAKNRDLVSTVTYGNGTKIAYAYDKADRLSKISHSVVGAATPFLKMSYSYDNRDLITGVIETDDAQQSSSVTYDYDNRGRLIEECRDGTRSYHLAYEYDQGGNRTSKTDWTNGTCVIYHYDTDADSTAPHKTNRLMSYDTFETACTGLQLESVIYDYALQGPAAGNPTQIRRKVASVPGSALASHVFSTCLKYNEAGELWVATQRTWIENTWAWADPSTVSASTWKSRQFRGIGQQRYMIRDLNTEDIANPSYAIMPDTTVWTDYDGVSASADYTIDAFGNTVPGTDYETGFAEVDPFGQVSYMHTDQIGTTRGMTDDTAAITTRPVYTAFGEPVFEDGAVGTRYRYAGSWGYESFTSLDWGTNTVWDVDLDFPYLHLGHRYYNPATGRFLQRDPIGIAGGLNVYAYVANSPTRSVDPLGLQTPAAKNANCQDVCDTTIPPGCNGYQVKLRNCYADCQKKLIPPAPKPPPKPPAPKPPAPKPPAPKPPAPKPPAPPAPGPGGTWNGKAVSVLLMMLALAALLRESPAKGRAGGVQ